MVFRLVIRKRAITGILFKSAHIMKKGSYLCQAKVLRIKTQALTDIQYLRANPPGMLIFQIYVLVMFRVSGLERLHIV